MAKHHQRKAKLKKQDREVLHTRLLWGIEELRGRYELSYKWIAELFHVSIATLKCWRDGRRGSIGRLEYANNELTRVLSYYKAAEELNLITPRQDSAPEPTRD